jgi:hypothetical protein
MSDRVFSFCPQLTMSATLWVGEMIKAFHKAKVATFCLNQTITLQVKDISI